MVSRSSPSVDPCAVFLLISVSVLSLNIICTESLETKENLEGEVVENAFNPGLMRKLNL